MDGIPDNRCNTRSQIAYQTVDRVPDCELGTRLGGLPGRVLIWPLPQFDSTGLHEPITSHQSEIFLLDIKFIQRRLIDKI